MLIITYLKCTNIQLVVYVYDTADYFISRIYHTQLGWFYTGKMSFEKTRDFNEVILSILLL